MPDPISTKLSVESDAWEAGFAAARKSLNRFGDDVNSTTAKIEAQIHTLKESFGRRSAFGELAEVFQGGGAIAGVGVAVEGLRRIYDAGQQIAEMVTHEQAKREEVVAATQRQNKELQGTVELMKRITSEREKVEIRPQQPIDGLVKCQAGRRSFVVNESGGGRRVCVGR